MINCRKQVNNNDDCQPLFEHNLTLLVNNWNGYLLPTKRSDISIKL